MVSPTSTPSHHPSSPSIQTPTPTRTPPNHLQNPSRYHYNHINSRPNHVKLTSQATSKSRHNPIKMTSKAHQHSTEFSSTSHHKQITPNHVQPRSHQIHSSHQPPACDRASALAGWLEGDTEAIRAATHCFVPALGQILPSRSSLKLM